MLKTNERLAELEREVERLAKAVDVKEIIGVVIDAGRYERLRRAEWALVEVVAENRRMATELKALQQVTR